ncbi:MAG: ABC-F family ATP-binding cassette domain-containing protein [Planctomycetes bacterium]|nr:ABC-F family ATP-binding cassette domain-containing protein [Planctomycetota bacterium]
MTLLTLHQVERAYGDALVFGDVSLRIAEDDRIGIVGDNGAGKTTLVKVLIGEDPPDRGERSVRRDLEIAWTAQIPQLTAGMTVLEAAQRSFARFEAMESELRELETAMAAEPENASLAARYERVHTAFEAGNGYRRHAFAERALQGLGFARDRFGDDVEVLSGGEKARVALAQAMLLPAELLILDEPTNHLDLEGIAFLEDWLEQRKGAFVLVSHDRRFLDRVCRSIVEIDSGQVTRYRGNYSAWQEQKARELETALREYEKQSEWYAKEMAYIRKHMGSRWTAQAKGRLKRLQRVERLARPRTGPGARMALRLGSAKGLSGQTVIEGKSLSLRYGDAEPLFEDVGFRVFHGDRIGILGRNGTGKSSLLEIIAGQQPATKGTIERSKTLRVGYFRQEMDDLPTSGTVLSTFMSLVPNWTEGECRDHLARFVFRGDDVDKDVRVLSGGEKRRLCLARLVVQPVDCYLLDEPTNHLDIATREALEEALDDFEGTIVSVSHDRWFLNRVIQRVFELTKAGIIVHEGGIEDYETSATARRRVEEAEKREQRQERRAESAAEALPSTASTASSNKIRNPYAFEKLEARIMELETEREELQAALHDENAWKDPERMKELQGKVQSIDGELQGLYETWENWQ